MKILLGREEVNPHKPDGTGKTPLMYAVGGRPQESDCTLLDLDLLTANPQPRLSLRRHHLVKITPIPSLPGRVACGGCL